MGVPPFELDSAAAERLEASWARRGVQNARIIEQLSWPYFMHFPQWAVREGYPWELLDHQGRNRTWYAGASACFESVNDVVEFNHMLIDRCLDGRR